MSILQPRTLSAATSALFSRSPLSALVKGTLRPALRTTVVGAGTAALLLLSSGSAQALTWKWSAVFDNGHRAEGLFDTGPGLPSTGATYTITGISGNYFTPSNTFSITGLSNNLLATNQFQWSGTGSPILSNVEGIAFTTADAMSSPGPIVNLYSVAYSSGDPDFLPLDEWLTESPGSVFFSGLITTSSLTPDVPGPLPILGASASFAWSRRLRRRVKRSSAASGTAE